MSFHAVTFSQESTYIQQFLHLPRRLYGPKELMQKPEEELAILTGTHVLSHYFTVVPLLVLDAKGTAVCRAVLTFYPDDPEAFLGFFESEDLPEAAALLFQKAEVLAKEHGCTHITGPVDASFWIRYRLKVRQFEHTYTGEPSNKDYYFRLWRSAEYEVTARYFSNHYIPAVAHQNRQFTARLAEKRAQGYIIKSPSRASFDKTLQDVYGLLIELYRPFPAYRPITEAEFTALYRYLKMLIRYPMVKMAYFQGQPVGFFISIPDYGTMVYGRLSLPKLVQIFLTRLRPKSYVMLYMGVDTAHRGLGKALAEAIREELSRTGVPSVGALIRSGNINRDYFQELVDYEFEYVLLGKKIQDSI